VKEEDLPYLVKNEELLQRVKEERNRSDGKARKKTLKLLRNES
jgi:hypothetical protein